MSIVRGYVYVPHEPGSNQDSSLLGAILVSEDTGQVSRVARPSNPLPTPLFSFQPLATSTEELDNIRKALAETEVIEGWFDPDLVECRFRPKDAFYSATARDDNSNETSRYETSGNPALQKESLEEELGKSSVHPFSKYKPHIV